MKHNKISLKLQYFFFTKYKYGNGCFYNVYFYIIKKEFIEFYNK